jgi:CelD/BcsL family acetyltransferase involved in cellulose biosynthesis
LKLNLEKDLSREDIFVFIKSFSHATFFHTPAWTEALAASFPNFKSRWITARTDGDLAGLMPVIESARGSFRSFWALPFGTYGDPLAGDPGTREALLDKFFDLAGGLSCLEASANLFHGDHDSVSRRGADIRIEECRLINLEGGFDEFWHKGLSHKKRQICNRCEREGIEVRPLGSEGEVGEFYRLYSDESSGWGGVHPYPKRLFVELFKRRDDGVFILGAFLGGVLLGGHVDMYFGEMAQAWQAGMSEEANVYGVGVLLIKYAVEEACNRGMKIFNLGSSGGNEGIIFFKESLGGREYRFPVASMQKRWWGWLKKR